MVRSTAAVTFVVVLLVVGAAATTTSRSVDWMLTTEMAAVVPPVVAVPAPLVVDVVLAAAPYADTLTAALPGRLMLQLLTYKTQPHSRSIRSQAGASGPAETLSAVKQTPQRLPDATPHLGI